MGAPSAILSIRATARRTRYTTDSLRDRKSTSKIYLLSEVAAAPTTTRTNLAFFIATQTSQCGFAFYPHSIYSKVYTFLSKQRRSKFFFLPEILFLRNMRIDICVKIYTRCNINIVRDSLLLDKLNLFSRCYKFQSFFFIIF